MSGARPRAAIPLEVRRGRALLSGVAGSSPAMTVVGGDGVGGSNLYRRARRFAPASAVVDRPHLAHRGVLLTQVIGAPAEQRPM
jgi:hypothetical protein